MSDDELPRSHPILIRQTARGVDYNWLWDRRNDEKFEDNIYKHFLSPVLDPQVCNYLSKKRMKEVINLRKVK